MGTIIVGLGQYIGEILKSHWIQGSGVTLIWFTICRIGREKTTLCVSASSCYRPVIYACIIWHVRNSYEPLSKHMYPWPGLSQMNTYFSKREEFCAQMRSLAQAPFSGDGLEKEDSTWNFLASLFCFSGTHICMYQHAYTLALYPWSLAWLNCWMLGLESAKQQFPLQSRTVQNKNPPSTRLHFLPVIQKHVSGKAWSHNY